MRGAEGVGVIVAEDAAAALQGVLVQVAGGPRLAKSAQVVGQVVGAAQSATSMGVATSSQPRWRDVISTCPPSPAVMAPHPSPISSVSSSGIPSRLRGSP